MNDTKQAVALLRSKAQSLLTAASILEQVSVGVTTVMGEFVKAGSSARTISPQARRKMALAQRRRWAKWHAEKAKRTKASAH